MTLVYVCLCVCVCVCVHACVCVCVRASAPRGINNHSTSGVIWCDIDRVWAFPCFQLLYMTLAVDKINERGLINTTCCERLPRKTKVERY